MRLKKTAALILGLVLALTTISAQATTIFTFTAKGTLPAPYDAQQAVDFGGWAGQIIDTSADGARLIASDAWAFNSNRTAVNRYVYLSADSGQTWTQANGLPNSEWGPVASSSTGQYLAAASYGPGSGAGGPLYTSSNYGATWTLATGAGTHKWWDVKMSNDGSTMVATMDHTGVPYLSLDFGATWSAFPGFASGQWRDAGVSGDGKVVAICNNNGPASGTRRTYVSRSGSIPTNYSSFTEQIDGPTGEICGSMDMSGDGTLIAANTWSNSQTRIWKWTSGSWALLNTLPGTVDWGVLPSISADGMTVLVPSYGQESDYISFDGGVTFEALTRTDYPAKVGLGRISPDGSKFYQFRTDGVYLASLGGQSSSSSQSNVNAVIPTPSVRYVTGLTGRIAYAGESTKLTLIGEGIGSLTSVSLGGIQVTPLSSTSSELVISSPQNLGLGSYDLVLKSSTLNFRFQDALQVIEKPIVIVKSTITCVKKTSSKTVKKVTDISPRCPTGFVKKP